MEEEEDNKLPVLDLVLIVNRKKNTHTNITIKKKLNHKESTKSGVIKGYAEREKALCDPQYLKRRTREQRGSL